MRKDRRDGARGSPPTITIEEPVVLMSPRPGDTAKTDIAVQDLPRPPEDPFAVAKKSHRGLDDGTHEKVKDTTKGLFEDIAPNTLPRPPEVPLIAATMSPQEPADDNVCVSDKRAEGVAVAWTPDTLRAQLAHAFSHLGPDALPPHLVKAALESLNAPSRLEA